MVIFVAPDTILRTSIAIADKETRGRERERERLRADNAEERKTLCRNLCHVFVSYGLYSSFEPAAVARSDIILHYYFCIYDDLCANKMPAWLNNYPY